MILQNKIHWHNITHLLPTQAQLVKNGDIILIALEEEYAIKNKIPLTMAVLFRKGFFTPIIWDDHSNWSSHVLHIEFWAYLPMGIPSIPCPR